ncbi:MAG: hypothetical protein QOG91_168 [Candidatus Parcubacteria bacterium]|jgi:predicted PurR-regulated permease PerM|nr:hypothetical protein [Candidatus Parcubacteria bacterium]
MNSRISSYFFFVLLLCAVVAAIVIFLPFLTPVVLAVAVAVLVYPIYRFFCRLFGPKKWGSSLASFLTVLVIAIVIMIPLFFFAARLYDEIHALYGMLTDESGRSELIRSLNSLSAALSDRLFNLFPAYSFDSFNITEYFKSALQWIFSNLNAIFSGFAKVVAFSFVFLIALFYFLRDGEAIKRKFISWSPLLDHHDEYITATLRRAIQSVFAGTIVVCIIQGILTGLGFLFFGIPAPALWGSVAALAALVPGIGTSLVLIPGIIYLIVSGNIPYAVGLAIWGALAVGTVDNILGPYLVNRGIQIHPFLILVSVLGGLATFGPIGFVFGPLIISFLFALLEIYRKSFGQKNADAAAEAKP